MIARPSPFGRPQKPDHRIVWLSRLRFSVALESGMKSQYVTDTSGLSGMLGTGTEGSESTTLRQAV
jgi:hypothetical protein